MKQSSLKSFTLIEILVVATIIGLLASIGSASFTQFTKQSRDARRKADLEQIRSAIEMYRSNNNSYPTTVTINCSSATGITDAQNTYLSKIPLDPKCTTYSYFYTATASDYTLGSYLEGGGTGSCGTCGTAIVCNYCLGPYGQK